MTYVHNSALQKKKERRNKMVNANVARTKMFSMLQTVNSKGNMKSDKCEQDFSSHMNQASAEKQPGAKVDEVSSEATETDKKTVLEKMLNAGKKDVQEAETTDELQGNNPEVIPVEEQVQELVKEIAQLISQIFGVTEKEIVEAMNAEDMQPSDLLQPASLTKLITKLTGNENPMALLTDSENSMNLKNLIQNVAVKLEEFTQQTGLTSDELQQQTDQMSVKLQGDELEVVTFTKEEIVQVTQQLQEETISQNNQVVHQGNEQNEKAQAVDVSQVNDGEQANSQENVVETQENETSENPAEDKNAKGEQQRQLEQSQTQTTAPKQSIAKTQTEVHQTREIKHHTQGVVNQFVETLSDKLDESMDRISAARIVRQVVDEIKIAMKPDTTSMELQLNPEHLGKVNINVSMKAGMITAQIAVSDAMVKEALENQIQVLRDNMNEQGMKIEAVEVVIAGHEFEQNLEKGKQENEEMAQARKGGKRKLRVADLEETEVEEISEDIVKLQTTSTISYQA